MLQTFTGNYSPNFLAHVNKMRYNGIGSQCGTKILEQITTKYGASLIVAFLILLATQNAKLVQMNIEGQVPTLTI